MKHIREEDLPLFNAIAAAKREINIVADVVWAPPPGAPSIPKVHEPATRGTITLARSQFDRC